MPKTFVTINPCGPGTNHLATIPARNPIMMTQSQCIASPRRPETALGGLRLPLQPEIYRPPRSDARRPPSLCRAAVAARLDHSRSDEISDTPGMAILAISLPRARRTG